jgi:hypothetical protein
MTVPYREWLIPSTQRTLHALDPDTHNYTTPSDWGTIPILYSKWGEGHPTAASYELWRAIFRVNDPTFGLFDGMDEAVDWGIEVVIAKDTFGSDKDFVRLSFEVIDHSDGAAATWDDNLVSGRYYDGVNNWSAYPQNEVFPYSSHYQLNFSGFTSDTVTRHAASFAAGAAHGNITAPKFFMNGVVVTHNQFFKAGVPDALLTGEEYSTKIICNRLEARFFNPVVNSISERRLFTAGGQSLILKGLGFDNSDTELSDSSRSHYNVIPGGGWQDRVDFIYIINTQTGAIVETLDYAPGDFTVDSNTQITIPTMPALAEGSYWLYLEKNNVAPIGKDVFAYAGDWRADIAGKVKPGNRLVFLVYDKKIPIDPPVPFFKWTWKYDDWLYEYYAPIDVRATERFWDGRVFGVSSITRGVDDRTGLFTIGDPTVDLANQDMHFSRLLSKYICKNQMVEISYGWGQEPEVWHEAAFFGMVDDHQLQGPNFHVQLKDWLQRYFKGQQPRFVIDSETYPDAKDSALTQPIPELLGEHSLTTGASPGAIEALCIDENNDIYAMAGGPLKAVPQVYSDGALIGVADYDLFVNVDGIQCIEFDNPQHDNKITFNCQGYMFGHWNSDDGYVQNPAYIIAFYLSLLLEIPIGYIDLDAVDALAQIFEDSGWGTAGKLAITMLEAPDAILQALLYSFGVKFWQKRNGILSIGRKDISNLETDLFFHTQIETMKLPEKPFNLQQAINTLQANWNFFPAADIYAGARTVTDEASIELFGTEMGPSEPWKFPWITSSSFAEQRVLEDLLKYAYGDRRVKISIPLAYIDQIEVFDNFRLQDPYGLSWTKEGDLGRYYYVLSQTPGLQAMLCMDICVMKTPLNSATEPLENI